MTAAMHPARAAARQRHAGLTEAGLGAVRRPLSPIEEGLLFDHFYGVEGAYVDQMSGEIIGDLDLERFQRTIKRLATLHEALRTSYVRDGAGRQVTALVREFADPIVKIVDLSNHADPRRTVQRRAASEAEIRFDLSKDVSRCTLFCLGPRLHVFVWTYHHVLADSWTLRILLQQFCTIYRGLSEETDDEALALPYGKYVEWVVGQDRAAALTAWKTYLGRFTSRAIEDPAPSAAGADRACLQLRLSGRTREAVEALRRQFKVTTNVILLAMWGIATLDQRQASDCLLGCVVLGRSVPVKGIETVAGVCANTVPVLVDRSESVRDLLSNLQHQVITASARSYLAISDVLATTGLSHHHLHSVVNFTIDERAVKNRDLDQLPFEIANLHYAQAATFDAYLDIEVTAEAIELTIHFDPRRRRFDADELTRKCEAIVRRLRDHADATVRDLLDTLLLDGSPLDVSFDFAGAGPDDFEASP